MHERVDSYDRAGHRLTGKEVQEYRRLVPEAFQNILDSDAVHDTYKRPRSRVVEKIAPASLWNLSSM